MKRLIILSLIATAFSAFAVNSQEAKDSVMNPRPQSVGLVLSGGGSKGIAHVGVIKALEENNIPIDYITGTSMGAIIGGLYASGYTPEEMMELLLSKPFSYWSTGQIDPSLVYYFATETPSPVMLSVPITSKRDSIQQAKSAVPASLISPMPMSFAFLELFSGISAQCGNDFDKLFVPYRCVASDVDAKHKVVLKGGNLGDAIRSSMSFPIVFQPTQLDTMLLYDGGIYDNFPVDVMKSTFAPGIIIGVDVSTPATGPQTSFMDQIENLVIQNNDYYLAPEEGIKLKIDLHEFGLLDFPMAKQIYQIGYDNAMSMIDSIKGRVTSRMPKEEVALRRAVFKSETPYIRFDSVKVTGGTPKQNTYLTYLFNSGKNDTLSLDKARRAYYRAISPGKLRDFAPLAYYNDSTGLFLLKLKASVKDRFKVGFGGYITSSTSSYVYLSAGYSTLSFSSISSNVGAWLGQSYLGAMLNSRIYLRTHAPSALELEAVAFRQKYYEEDYIFYEDKAPSYILDHEYFGRLKLALAAGSLGTVEFGTGYGYLNDSFYQPNKELGYLSERDHCKFNLAQAFARYESNTLNDINFPVQGRLLKATAMGVMGRYKQDYGEDPNLTHANLKWVQIEGLARCYMPMGRHFSFGVEGDVMLSTRKLLNDYNASIVTAPAFLPTPSSYNSFNSAFRANSFLAAGVVPIYRYNDNISARVQGYCFLPLRKIEENATGGACYSQKWLSNPQFFGEFDLCYTLPFATVTGYCNYMSSPSNNWNIGISFGVFMPAPRFLR